MIGLLEAMIIFAVTDDNKGKNIIDYQKVEKKHIDILYHINL